MLFVKPNNTNLTLKKAGFLATATLYEPNKIPVPKAPIAKGNIAKPKTTIFILLTSNIYKNISSSFIYPILFTYENWGVVAPVKHYICGTLEGHKI